MCKYMQFIFSVNFQNVFFEDLVFKILEERELCNSGRATWNSYRADLDRLFSSIYRFV